MTDFAVLLYEGALEGNVRPLGHGRLAAEQRARLHEPCDLRSLGTGLAGSVCAGLPQRSPFLGSAENELIPVVQQIFIKH